MLELTLASTSPYRKALLERLNIPFTCYSPLVDEAPLPGESAHDLVIRLAQTKARAAIAHASTDLIIGSDQVALLDDHIIGKPGSRDAAIAQLKSSSGRSVLFLTGLCLLNRKTNRQQICVEPFKVHFRHLSNEQIERYIDKEQPLDCAGSFKSEGLGICLFSHLEGDDPNSLIGLPLIQLVSMLTKEGVQVP